MEMYKKHTVLICSNAYPPNFIGGAELIAHYQAKELMRKGHEVIVFAGETYSDYKQYHLYKDNYDGLTVYRIRLNSENFDSNYDNFANSQVEDAFIKLIDKYKPTVVHCHNLIGLSIGILNIAHNKKIKTVVTLHDHWGYCYKNTILKNKDKLCNDTTKCSECKPYITGNGKYIPMNIRSNYFKFIMHNMVDCFISPSQYIADCYINAGFPSEKMNVIWNGIDIERFSNVIKKPSDKIRLTYVGYFGKHKGVLLMLQALKKLNNKDIQLNLVGEGEEKNSYIKYARENGMLDQILFWGKVPNSEILKVYENTDIYFLASIWPENQPVSITEALATGTPVIASNLGGNKELINDGVDGYLFEANNYKNLVEKVQKFIDNRERISTLGLNGKEKIMKNSYAKQVDKILDKYDTITNDSSKLEKFYIGICGDRVPDNLSLDEKYQFLMLDWMKEWDYDLLNMIIILKNYKISDEKLYKLIDNKIFLNVPEENELLKQIVIRTNYGLYYRNETNIIKYISYIISNNYFI